MNVKLLRKIERHILEEPKRFAMEWWYGKAVPGEAPYLFNANSVAPKCGTVACIAGWACVLGQKKFKGENQDIQLNAAKLLGLRDGIDRRLFSVNNWPAKYRDHYSEAKTRRAKAKAAVARIEHFIKTKG